MKIKHCRKTIFSLTSGSVTSPIHQGAIGGLGVSFQRASTSPSTSKMAHEHEPRFGYVSDSEIKHRGFLLIKWFCVASQQTHDWLQEQSSGHLLQLAPLPRSHLKITIFSFTMETLSGHISSLPKWPSGETMSRSPSFQVWYVYLLLSRWNSFHNLFHSKSTSIRNPLKLNLHPIYRKLDVSRSGFFY